MLANMISPTPAPDPKNKLNENTMLRDSKGNAKREMYIIRLELINDFETHSRYSNEILSSSKLGLVI